MTKSPWYLNTSMKTFKSVHLSVMKIPFVLSIPYMQFKLKSLRLSCARMILSGLGCRLQTCSRLASEWFDSTIRANYGVTIIAHCVLFSKTIRILQHFLVGQYYLIQFLFAVNDRQYQYNTLQSMYKNNTSHFKDQADFTWLCEAL